MEWGSSVSSEQRSAPPKPLYALMTEKARVLIAPSSHCSLFCKGATCKYCNSENWTDEQKALPGLYSSWVTSKILAMARPTIPCIEKNNLYDAFLGAEIRSIINLQKPGEHGDCGPCPLHVSGFSYDPAEFMKRNVCYQHTLMDIHHIASPHSILVFFYNFAWNDFGVGTLDNLMNMVRVMKFAVSEGKVAVHCHAGLGRTGVVIASYLVLEYKISANEAINYVRYKRPGSIQTREQLQFVRDFERYLVPMRVIFHSIAKSYAFNVSQFLVRQRHVLYGDEARALKNLPKIVSVLCEKLLLMAGRNCLPDASVSKTSAATSKLKKDRNNNAKDSSSESVDSEDEDNPHREGRRPPLAKSSTPRRVRERRRRRRGAKELGDDCGDDSNGSLGSRESARGGEGGRLQKQTSVSDGDRESDSSLLPSAQDRSRRGTVKRGRGKTHGRKLNDENDNPRINDEEQLEKSKRGDDADLHKCATLNNSLVAKQNISNNGRPDVTGKCNYAPLMAIASNPTLPRASSLTVLSAPDKTMKDRSYAFLSEKPLQGKSLFGLGELPQLKILLFPLHICSPAASDKKYESVAHAILEEHIPTSTQRHVIDVQKSINSTLYENYGVVDQEKDPLVIVQLLAVWLVTLKEPVITVQIAAILTAAADQPRLALRKLTKDHARMIFYLASVWARLLPSKGTQSQQQLERNLLLKLLSFLTHRDLVLDGDSISAASQNFKRPGLNGMKVGALVTFFKTLMVDMW